jgi:ADP-heptose:LPS heptosyltransferase
MIPSAKILVIRGGAIGDFILTLPVFAALRRQFPGVHLEALGYPHVAKLALLDKAADAIKPIEARALAGFFAKDGSLDPGWAAYFADFAIIISYLYDPDEIFRANIARCSVAQYLVGPHRPGSDLSLSVPEALLKPLERLAIFEADPIPRIRIEPDAVPVARRRVALHPGSGSETKNWPERRWAEFCRLVLDHTSHDLLLVGGEAEGERLERLALGLASDRVAVAQALALPELAKTLAQCESFVGHDSGISHLAAALGVESLLLWGNTSTDPWRPLNPQVAVYRHEAGLKELPAPKVFELWREWTR